MMRLFKNPRLVGIGLILLGLTANPTLLISLLSADGDVQPHNVVIIWLFDALCICLGTTLLMSGSWITLLNATIGLAITIALIFGLDRLIWSVQNAPPVSRPTAPAAAPPPGIRHEGSYTHDFFHPDELLSYKPRPDSQVDSVKYLGDELVYDVVYTIDAHSRRVTAHPNPNPPHLLLFFGDSFMFGEGVNDDQTFPHDVAQTLPDYEPFNYGFSGYGPQQMLAKLETDDFPAEVGFDPANPRDVIGVYLFIDAHVERAIGSMYVHNAWGDTMPYYALDWRGKLTHQGNFTNGRPVIATLYKNLPYSGLASYFNVTIPPRLTTAHYHLTSRIIEEARNRFRTQFQSEQFYVIVYPDEGDYIEDMLPHFDQAGLIYFNYDERLKLDVDEGLAIKGDGHPTGKAHQQVAEWFVEDLAQVR